MSKLMLLTLAQFLGVWLYLFLCVMGLATQVIPNFLGWETCTYPESAIWCFPALAACAIALIIIPGKMIDDIKAAQT